MGKNNTKWENRGYLMNAYGVVGKTQTEVANG